MAGMSAPFKPFGTRDDASAESGCASRSGEGQRGAEAFGPSSGRVRPRIGSALAEKIHDGPLQDLAAMSLKLAAMSKGGERDQAEDVHELYALVLRATRDLRNVIDPDYVEPAPRSLAAQLRELGASFSEQWGIRCDVDVSDHHCRFDHDVADVIYRSVNELLANVRKHSQASRVEITSMADTHGNIEVRVRDNGIGLASSQWRGTPFEGGGFGLWSIEHRMSSFGGSMTIDGSDGVCVTLSVPAPRAC
jgi:signal transduction histidine kinase